MPTINPPTLQRFLTYRLAQVQSKLNAQAIKLLRGKAGVSLAQWRIILLIGATPGARATDLTRLSAIDKGQFSRKLKALVEDGLVDARPDAVDHRTVHLYLTESGQALHDRTLPHMRARQEALIALMTDSEQALFFDVLDRLDHALEHEELG